MFRRRPHRKTRSQVFAERYLVRFTYLPVGQKNKNDTGRNRTHHFIINALQHTEQIRHLLIGPSVQFTVCCFPITSSDKESKQHRNTVVSTKKQTRGSRRSVVDVTVQLICQKRERVRRRGGSSVCTVNWQRIGGRACNSTGKLSAFQTSLYAGRTHTSNPSLFLNQGRNRLFPLRHGRRSKSLNLLPLFSATVS